jgi:hypothetical protein
VVVILVTEPWLDPASVADAGAFLARLVKLDAAALVRLRPAGGGVLALWARLPFEVLVTRRVRAGFAEDATVRAADLLRALESAGPSRHARLDSQWRWPVPADPGRVVERIPVAEVRRLGAAAETTLREAVARGVRGRAVGERVLRDALLDHVPVVVITDDGARFDVPQRLVQAVVRMGFLGATAGDRSAGEGSARGEGPTAAEGATGEVEVRVAAGGWVGLAGAFGTGWFRPSTVLDVRPIR